MKRFLLNNLAVLFGAILLLVPSFAIGQTASRIAITPLNFELTVERGEVGGDQIRVLNSSYEEDVSVTMKVEDMFPEGEEGRVILQSPDEDLDTLAISRWVSFEPETFTLEPREQKNVRFTIEVPETADPGGHYAGLIAGTQEREIEGTGVGITHRIASLVLLTVPGEMIEDLSVVDFKTGKDYYEQGPITFESRFKNEGTVHIQPDATVLIEDIFGREVARVPVEKRNVLPDATRKIETEWNVGNLWGGRYTATLTGSYGMESLPIEEKQVTFWAFPWKAGIGIILVLIFFILTRKRWITIIKILIQGEKALSDNK